MKLIHKINYRMQGVLSMQETAYFKMLEENDFSAIERSIELSLDRNVLVDFDGLPLESQKNHALLLKIEGNIDNFTFVNYIGPSYLCKHKAITVNCNNVRQAAFKILEIQSLSEPGTVILTGDDSKRLKVLDFIKKYNKAFIKPVKFIVDETNPEEFKRYEEYTEVFDIRILTSLAFVSAYKGTRMDHFAGLPTEEFDYVCNIQVLESVNSLTVKNINALNKLANGESISSKDFV